MWPKPQQALSKSYKTKVKEKVITFDSSKMFREWLKKHHTQTEGIWLRFYKKDSGKKTFAYNEALDEALCFGWIDSLVQKYDADSYIQKFSPRKPKSVWSQRNIEHIQRLIQTKRMHSSGMRAYQLAQNDGRLNRAYAPPSKAVIPNDLQKIIATDPKMKAYTKTLNRSAINAISYRLSTAKKPETRAKRLQAILSMLRSGTFK